MRIELKTVTEKRGKDDKKLKGVDKRVLKQPHK